MALLTGIAYCLRPLPNCLAFWLAKKCSVNDTVPVTTYVDWIVPVAHGATEKRLVNGSVAVMNKVVEIYKNHPESRVFFGSFAGDSNPELEAVEKSRFIYGVIWHHFGSVWSTIMECMAFKKTASCYNLNAGQTILVVTDDAHSRRCKMVWQCFFPDYNVLVVAVPLALTIDKESPMTNYNWAWKAFVLQVFPTPIFTFWCSKGPDYLALQANVHQPTRK